MTTYPQRNSQTYSRANSRYSRSPHQAYARSAVYCEDGLRSKQNVREYYFQNEKLNYNQQVESDSAPNDEAEVNLSGGLTEWQRNDVNRTD
jgi:hypothetical protein